MVEKRRCFNAHAHIVSMVHSRSLATQWLLFFVFLSNIIGKYLRARLWCSSGGTKVHEPRCCSLRRNSRVTCSFHFAIFLCVNFYGFDTYTVKDEDKVRAILSTVIQLPQHRLFSDLDSKANFELLHNCVGKTRKKSPTFSGVQYSSSPRFGPHMWWVDPYPFPQSCFGVERVRTIPNSRSRVLDLRGEKEWRDCIALSVWLSWWFF